MHGYILFWKLYCGYIAHLIRYSNVTSKLCLSIKRSLSVYVVPMILGSLVVHSKCAMYVFIYPELGSFHWIGYFGNFQW